jgi:hypothetical protein
LELPFLERSAATALAIGELESTHESIISIDDFLEFPC